MPILKFIDKELDHRFHLFMLRIWLEELGNGETEWRGKVKCVMSDEVRYFRNWDVLISIIRSMLEDNIQVESSGIDDESRQV